MHYAKALNAIQKITLQKNFNDSLQKIVDYLYESFDTYSWVGIYLIQDNNLILKVWQGKQATQHTKIPIGTGICGFAAQSGKTEIIDNVQDDQRYLACFRSTQSEIVVPIKKEEKIIGEIDIDSDHPAAFSQKDKQFLEKVADMLSSHIA